MDDTGKQASLEAKVYNEKPPLKKSTDDEERLTKELERAKKDTFEQTHKLATLETELAALKEALKKKEEQ